MMHLFRLWVDGITRPFKLATALSSAPAPAVGLAAVLIRFVATSLTSILSLYLLGRLPFVPSELTELPTERYYLAEMFFLPLWGLAIWILMASVVYLSLRFTSTKSDHDKILNIIGMGMLVPMPLLWIWDWTAIAVNIYTVTNQAITHSIAQTWEATIQVVCYVKVLKIRLPIAIFLAVVTNACYVLLAMHFIR
jgi:hypothetical protein